MGIASFHPLPFTFQAPGDPEAASDTFFPDVDHLATVLAMMHQDAVLHTMLCAAWVITATSSP